MAALTGGRPPRTLFAVVPGALSTRTGGSIYDRRIVEGLRRQGWTVHVCELGSGFPSPSSDVRAHATASVGAIPDGSVVLFDGLAFSALPELVAAESRRLRFAAVIHLPLALEHGLDEHVASRLASLERRALTAAALVVVTGPETAKTLAGYGVPGYRIVLVEPGTDLRPVARGSGGPDVILLSVGTVSPGKGQELLVRALAAVGVRQWRLICAGSTDRYPSTVHRLQTTINALGLDGRVDLTGELDDEALERRYDAADVFVLATMRETYGMAVAEALAHGLPVVATATGAIPALVDGDAGIVVPLNDEAALTTALAEVISNRTSRERFAVGARRVRERLPSWDSAAEKMASALGRLFDE